MLKKAFVFPGQGAQFAGMGQDLYQNSAAAKIIFEKAESLKKGIIDMCFNGTIADLSVTINTQPCIFTVSLACAAALNERGENAEIAAGFSSGELAALTFARALSFEDGFNAILKRAQLMHEAALKTKGCMAAVLKIPAKTVTEIASECGVYAVNYNCENQTVVAGENTNMESFYTQVAKVGGRALPLKVSGAFHSPFMLDASKEFNKYLKTINMTLPKIKVYSNYSSFTYTDDVAKNYDLLSKQIASPVLWHKSVQNMISDGVEGFTEMQPGSVLTGLIGKIKEKKNA